MRSMLEVHDLRVSYHGVPALHGVSLRVARGELIALIGANGAGKTTTLKAVAGALRPEGGRIAVDGVDVTRWSTPEMVRLGVTYVPEGRLVFGPMSVEENLRLGAFVVRSRREIDDRLDYVYQLFPRLKERRRQPAGTLSGGEQQMLAIGRGLMAGPRLLMLDEPSLGLMPRLVEELFATIARLRRDGLTVLLVEQSAREALELADRAYVLQTGRTVGEGTGQELLRSERVRQAFLGL